MEDAYETMDSPQSEFDARYREFEIPSSTGDLETMVRQLGDICEEAVPLGIRGELR